MKIGLGDIQWPEGLWKGIEKMRKNEKAKIRIKKKKYGFGRKGNADKLRIPPGYEAPLDPDSEEGKKQLEKRERLFKKGLIYEVKLLDWVDRTDIEADGNFLKTVLKPASSKKEWEKPSERDEFIIDARLYVAKTDPALSSSEENEDVKDRPLIVREGWSTNMADPEFPFTIRKILETMKRGEHTSTTVKASYIKD